MDEISKNDSLKLASRITGNCGDDPKEEFHSHSDEARGSHQLQLQFGDRLKQFQIKDFGVAWISF